MPSDDRVIVEVDSRGRVSLNRVLQGERYKYYFAEVDEGGTVTLTPAVVVPQSAVDEALGG